MYNCSTHSIGSSKILNEETTKWDILEAFKAVCRNVLRKVGVSSEDRKKLYQPIIKQERLSKEMLKELPAFQALDNKTQLEVMDFLQTHKLLMNTQENTQTHPADLVDEEACQSVSMGVPTLKAANSNKPYF